MTVVSTPYHQLTCNGRIDNLVDPACTTRSPGNWDLELMHLTAKERGWREHGRGHLCPSCASAQDAKVEPVDPLAAATPKRRRGKTDATGSAADPWAASAEGDSQ